MPFLQMEDVHKRFGGVRALRGASLEVNAGEVHGLLGPNGSGKSTLNKVLSGTVNPDQATITVDGKPVTIARPLDAHRERVASAYQQLSLVPHLSIQDNLLLGTEIGRAGFVNRRAGREYAQKAIAHFIPGMDRGTTLATEVGDLRPGSQQLVEIAKAVARDPRILVLDEATASLRHEQVDLVFDLIRTLVDDGMAVLFVSHRLEEVKEICHRATILRNGQTVATVNMADTTESALVRLMVGEVADDQAEIFEDIARVSPSDEAQLQTLNLNSADLHDINIDARKGEVVGLGGLQGQGQSELLHVLFGDSPRSGGEILVGGEKQNYHSPRGAIASGIALVPGDRYSQGLLSVRPIIENLNTVSLKQSTVFGWFINVKRARDAARAQVEALRIKIGSLRDPVSTLSGGNQQKVVIGKWLMQNPRVVLLDDPTKGIDVGAKAEIYELIRRLASDGITVLINSSDDNELAALCDRVFVLYEGGIVQVIEGSDVTQDNLVAAALRIDETEGAARD